MPPAVRVSGVSKTYGDTRILDGVSFELERGEMAAISGRSGSGKTTVFKLLAALDRPTSGTIEIGGRSIGGLDDDAIADLRLRHIGIVFQSFNLLPELSAIENVRLPLDLAGVSRGSALPRARSLLDKVGLADRTEAKPNVLSGGEQQRVAIARALANEPELLLADEPTGNLDRKNAESVLGVLASLNETGTTILIITHDEASAARFPRRFLLTDGRLGPHPTTGATPPSPLPPA